MIVRKLWRFEGAHIQRNCGLQRKSHSIHGHSAQIEVFLTSDKLDRGGMVVDFGLLKGPINDFIDSFDHTLSLWSKDNSEFIKQQLNWSDRWVKMPVSPSAENYALMFLFIIDKIIQNTTFNNGEGNVKVIAVRYHETVTGYAEADRSNLSKVWINYNLEDIEFSEGIKSEWKDKEWFDNLIKGVKFINPIIPQQIIINE